MRICHHLTPWPLPNLLKSGTTSKRILFETRVKSQNSIILVKISVPQIRDLKLYLWVVSQNMFIFTSEFMFHYRSCCQISVEYDHTIVLE